MSEMLYTIVERNLAYSVPSLLKRIATRALQSRESVKVMGRRSLKSSQKFLGR